MISIISKAPTTPAAPLVFAHRGVSSLAPENTLAAFRLAAKLGVDGIELDVQLSRDGIPVVIHDDRLERTSNGAGRVRHHTYAELHQLDCGGWFGPAFAGECLPALEEALAAFPGLVNVEIKQQEVEYAGIEEAVVEVLRRAGALERAIVSSFDHRSVRRVHELEPALSTAVLFVASPVDPGLDARAASASAVHPQHLGAYPWLVQAAHGAGLAVRAWTVDTEEDVARVVGAGVDAIVSNVPHRVKEWLGARK